MGRKQVKREPVSQHIGVDAAGLQSASQGQGPPSSPGNIDVERERVVPEARLDNAMPEDIQTGIHTQTAHITPDNALQSQSSDATIVATPPNDLTLGSQGLELLGRGVKQLVQAVQNLRHLGVEDLILPLPKIVVVGDQSTGKSSLIEGISEIKVPRKLGVCTRCPLEINLSENANKDDPWTCVVSLYKRYMYDGSQGRGAVRIANKNGPGTIKPEGATRKRPLGPWVLQEGENFLFAKTTNKDDVADMLEWAQYATLNPKDPFEDYVPWSTGFKGNRNYQVKFSPNVIRLEISGPFLPNLSFYDLPGVINVSDVPEEGYLVDLVKNLVKEYIQADNSINLLTLPMTDDPANSSASKLIRDEKAEARTVGVLTKPDRVQEQESLEQWIHILGAERFVLGHGYHIVKNNPDVGVDHAVARAQERDFFANRPWSTVLSTYESKFGTHRLQNFLSQILTAEIRTSLPRIVSQVKEKLNLFVDRDAHLPKAPTGNLPLKILEKVMRFESEIQKHFSGGNASYTLPKQWRNLADNFRKHLAESRPLLTLSTSNVPSSNSRPSQPQTPTPAQRGNGSFSEAIELDSASDNDNESRPAPKSGSIRSDKKRVNNGDLSGETSVKRQRMIDIPLYTSAKATDKPNFSRRFSLADIRGCLQDGHIGLPNEIDPRATQFMIKDSVKGWQTPTQSFLDSTLALCQNTVFEQVQRTFTEWNNTTFYTRVTEICDAFLNRVMTEQSENVARFLKYETQKPVTLNVEAITDASEKALVMLQQKRREQRILAYIDQQDAADRTSSRLSRSDRVAKVSDAQLGPDPYSREVLAISVSTGPRSIGSELIAISMSRVTTNAHIHALWITCIRQSRANCSASAGTR